MKTKLHYMLILFIASAFAFAAQANAASSGISLNQAAKEAVQIAAYNPGWKAMLGSGKSMAPHYGKGDVLLVDSANLNRVRPGMMVVYRDQSGDLVGHTVMSKTAEGLQVKGVNNAKEDIELVTKANYEGVIVGILHTDGKGAPTGLPVVIGKSN